MTGPYKPRKCRQCGETFTPARPLQPVCGVSCAILFSREQKANKVKRERRKEKREWKERTKTIGQRLQEAQRVFNAWIRWRDRGRPCISCRSVRGKRNAGHYIPAGRGAALRFDAQNVHGQCEKCNSYLSGNLVQYRLGLIAKIGIEAVSRLEGPQPPVKWTHDQLKAIKAEYTRRLREAKASND